MCSWWFHWGFIYLSNLDHVIHLQLCLFMMIELGILLMLRITEVYLSSVIHLLGFFIMFFLIDWCLQWYSIEYHILVIFQFICSLCDKKKDVSYSSMNHINQCECISYMCWFFLNVAGSILLHKLWTMRRKVLLCYMQILWLCKFSSMIKINVNQILFYCRHRHVYK